MKAMLAACIAVAVLLAVGCGGSRSEPALDLPSQDNDLLFKGPTQSVLVGAFINDSYHLGLMNLPSGRIGLIEPPARMLDPAAPEYWPIAGAWGFSYPGHDQWHLCSWDLTERHFVPGQVSWITLGPTGAQWAAIAGNLEHVVTWPATGHPGIIEIGRSRPRGLAWPTPNVVVWGRAVDGYPAVWSADPTCAEARAKRVTIPRGDGRDPWEPAIGLTVLGSPGPGLVVMAAVLDASPLRYHLVVWDLAQDTAWYAPWVTCAPVWASAGDDVLIASASIVPCEAGQQPLHRFYFWHWSSGRVEDPGHCSPWPWVAALDGGRWAFIDSAGDIAVADRTGRVLNRFSPPLPLAYLGPYPAPARPGRTEVIP